LMEGLMRTNDVPLTIFTKLLLSQYGTLLDYNILVHLASISPPVFQRSDCLTKLELIILAQPFICSRQR